jgi:dihydroorotase
MRFDTLITGAAVVWPEGRRRADVGITDGKIAAIGDLSSADAAEKLDARGLTMLPGLIDTQVHFREPGMEHKEDLESGTRAAIVGGVTSILEMPNTIPPTTTQEALEDKFNRAAGRAWCDHGFFVGAAHDNVGKLAELEKLPGCAGIKIFMGSSTGTLLIPDDDTLRRVLRDGRKRCPVHAEDHELLEQRKAMLSEDPHPREHPFIRSVDCAVRATNRLIALSEETGRPVHILHISTLDEPGVIAEAKKRGVDVTAEVTPQHLFFAAPECYEQLGSRAQMNPPVRESEHREGLRQALADGVFDMIGSDHAPHTLEEKALPYPKSPSGMPGVQTLLSVMLTLAQEGLLSVEDLVRLAAENPAKIYRIDDKGRIEEGRDADVVLVDLNKDFVVERSWLQSKCGWSPYEGLRLAAPPEHVFLRGELMIRDGRLVGEQMGARLSFS